MSVTSYLEKAKHGDFQWECIEATDGYGMGGALIESTSLDGRSATVTREDTNQFLVEIDLKLEPYYVCEYRSSRKHARILAERLIRQNIAKEQLTSRCARANQLIQLIAETDRKFFNTKGNIALLVVDRNKVAYIDNYTQKSIKIEQELYEWDGFSHGGTLKSFIFSLGQWVRGEKDQFFGMYSASWGYTLDGMCQIVEKARELDMIPVGEETFKEYYEKLDSKGYVVE